jgi:8-oxo-dGTP diphosphatase
MKSKKALRPRILFVNRAFVINRQGKFLIIRRSLNDQSNAGEWEIPGGKLDEGQDVTHALEREVFEETGLLVRSTSRVAYYESYIVPTGPYKGLPYLALIGICKLEKGKVVLSSEHDSFAWVNVSESGRYLIRDEVRRAILILKKDLR